MKRSFLLIFLIMIVLQQAYTEEIDIDLIKVPNYVFDESDIQLYKIRKQQLESLKQKYMKMGKEERQRVEKQSLAFQKWENELKRKYQYRKRQDEL